MKNKNRAIEILLLGLILVMIAFVAGIFIGRQVERRAAAKEVQNLEEFTTEDIKEDITEETQIATTEAPTQTKEVETVSSNTVSHNTTPPQTEEPVASVSDNGMPKPKWNENYQETSDKKRIEERQAIRSSYEETMAINAEDKKIIAESTVDFSNMKIACLGDSITEGYSGMIPYPVYLQEVLGAKEVVNLGKGGSTIASVTGDGAYPMAQRVDDVPLDTDVIVVMGGTNDNFYQKEWQYGFLYWDSKGDGTFCGGVQLLMRRIKWIRPNVKALFFVPPSNSLVDELKKQDPGLQDFQKYSEAIRYIGMEEGMPVVDLYNANFMNSHDTTIMQKYMKDKAHPNSEGNRLIAERIAAELIKRYQ